MYNREKIQEFVDFIAEHDGIADKKILAEKVQSRFSLTKTGKVFHCEDFAVRFSKSDERSFSNTILALSVLKKYDDLPFFVCRVTPRKNYLMLANTTFLKKISQSSHKLRTDNIRGSFNGSDIVREFGEVENLPPNFESLFNLHEGYDFEENLERLVEATSNIKAGGRRFIRSCIKS